MTKERSLDWNARSELSFWACFAVVFALLSQTLFPPQVMAASVSGHRGFVLCMDAPGAAPAVDTAAEKLFSATHKSKPYQGLKCADCVIASVTAIAAPLAVSVPIRYAAEAAEPQTETSRSPAQARAPPRPFSCGPPARI